MSGWYRRLSGRSLPSLIIAGLVTLAASAVPIKVALARASGNGEICRISIEALMWGDIDAALAAIDPGPEQHELFKNYLTRLNSRVTEAFFQGRKPRLERTLEDIKVKTHPASLQIWTFGGDDAHVVGCLFRIEEDKTIQIDFQIRDSVEEVVDGFEARLK
jgi:hypothetical protein